METKKKNKILIIALIILVVVNMATVASIWLMKPTAMKYKHKYKKENRYKSDKSNREDRFIKKLDLNERQAIEFKEEKKLHFQKISVYRDSIMTRKQLIVEEIFKENPDTNLIKTYNDSIGILNTKVEKLNYNHFIRIKEILNTKQQDKFKEIVQKASLRDKGKNRNCNK